MGDLNQQGKQASTLDFEMKTMAMARAEPVHVWSRAYVRCSEVYTLCPKTTRHGYGREIYLACYGYGNRQENATENVRSNHLRKPIEAYAPPVLSYARPRTAIAYGH